jgi:putative exosortase-associated protein (TIGR04073 family)
MKKHVLVLGIAAFVFLGGVAAAPADDNAFTKFGRGAANIVTSPGELYTQPILLTKTQAASTSIFGGMLKGTVVFLMREVVGIYEIITFPIPPYGPIIKPATTFTDWDTRKPKES